MKFIDVPLWEKYVSQFPEYYRVKTEKEIAAEYGNQWKSSFGFSNDMEKYLGTALTLLGNDVMLDSYGIKIGSNFIPLQLITVTDMKSSEELRKMYYKFNFRSKESFEDETKEFMEHYKKFFGKPLNSFTLKEDPTCVGNLICDGEIVSKSMIHFVDRGVTMELKKDGKADYREDDGVEFYYDVEYDNLSKFRMKTVAECECLFKGVILTKESREAVYSLVKKYDGLNLLAIETEEARTNDIDLENTIESLVSEPNYVTTYSVYGVDCRLLALVNDTDTCAERKDSGQSKKSNNCCSFEQPTETQLVKRTRRIILN